MALTGFAWDEVVDGQVADTDQMNELGQAVQDLDEQILTTLHADSINFIGASETTSSSSYADLGASSFSFTKLKAATKLRFDLHATCSPNAINTAVQYAVLIGGTDYDIAFLMLNTSGPHLQASGVRVISGLPAGLYTVKGRWKRASGAATLTRDGNDALSICAMECG